MDMESIMGLMDSNMKVNGKTICQMELAKPIIKMGVDISDNF